MPDELAALPQFARGEAEHGIAVAAEQPRHAHELLSTIGPELLLHASDYPHDHGGADALYAALGDDETEDVRSRNAASLYRL